MSKKVKNVRICTLGKFLLPIALGLIISTNVATAQSGKPPTAVASTYEASQDWSISDDFSSINWNKWTYRDDNGTNGIGEGSQYAYIVNSGGDSFLSLKGNGTTKKGGGLGSLVPANYGFYITKFKMVGFSSTSTAWHPSIWGSPWNMGVNARSLNPLPRDWVEIDMMEFTSWPSKWHCQAIPRINNVREDPANWPKMLPSRTWGFAEWTIIGLEYHPQYMQLWEYRNGSWSAIGTKVWTSWVGNAYNKLWHSCRCPQYWILSNKYHEVNGAYQGDSWFHIDFFYYYPLKGFKSAETEEFANVNSDELTLYPNPTSGDLKISGLENGTYSMKIYNVQGKLILSSDINALAGNSSIDVTDLTKGIYIMNINSAEQTKIVRFVKE